MSTSMYWRIIPEPPKEHSIGYLKHVLAKRLFGEDCDGSMSESPVTVDQSLVPFLEGVASVGEPQDPHAKDAQRLIDAIRKYGKVEVYIQ